MENLWIAGGSKRCRLCRQEAQRNSQRRKRGLEAPLADPGRSAAARRGGQKTAENRQHMAEIGKKGGQIGGRISAYPDVYRNSSTVPNQSEQAAAS